MPIPSTTHRLLAVLAAAAFAAAPALADKDDKGGKHHGDGKSEKHAHKHEDKHEDKAERKAEKAAQKADRKAEKHAAKAHRELPPGGYFSGGHRDAVRTYYVQHYGPGKSCPPGLAKKNNGCQPPGHAKRWHVGQPLPRDVVYYSVPQQVLVQLPPQPAGYRYVRVDGDLLLIALGTLMVIDGMDGLMRM